MNIPLVFTILFAAITSVGTAQVTSSAIRGQVRDSSGAAIPGARVQLDPGAHTTESGTDGGFRIDGLSQGTYLLTVDGKGFVPAQQTVVVSSGEGNGLEIRLFTIQTSIEVRERSDSFLATSSVSVTKSPQALIDLPYAVQVIPKALLEDRAIQDIKDLYRNISGVTDSPYSAMTVRGFTQREVLFNGVRGNPYGSLENDLNDAGFSTSLGRLTNVEFVEVLKGPAAVLFGAAEPGGVVNFVTKKPRTEHSAEASFRTGTFRQRGGHGELTGPLWKARQLYYRAAWYQEDRRTFRYNTSNENLHLATGLSWRLREATSLGFEYEYIDQYLPGNRLRGIPVNALGVNLTNREWTASEPSDSSALQGRIFQARADHAFTPTLRMDATFRYLNTDRPELYHEPRGINADGRTMRREFRNQFRGNNDWTLAANGYQRVSGKGFGTHNVAFGVESVHQDWTGRYGTAREQVRGGPVPDIDMFAPVYGLTSGSRYVIAPGAFTLQTVDSRRTGVFVQDQIELLPRLQVLLGGRVERFSDKGQAAGTPLAVELTAFTGRAGMVYRVLPRVSLFGSISNSFNRAPALAQTPLANGPHDAETGRQWEGGAKAELSGGRVLMTASLFEITKSNLLRPDPNFGPRGDNFSAVFPVGKARNRGFEIDLTGRITRDFSALVNYAFLDSEILADRFTPSAVGGPLPNAPRHAFGLFARYDIRKTKTGLTIGNESRGRRFEPYAGFPAAGYGIWDFGVFQQVHRMLELRVQLDNGFDKQYAASSLFVARAGNVPGAPRTVTMSLHFRSLGRD
jgi:iron complex outermembrane receptor protein